MNTIVLIVWCVAAGTPYSTLYIYIYLVLWRVAARIKHHIVYYIDIYLVLWHVAARIKHRIVHYIDI